MRNSLDHLLPISWLFGAVVFTIGVLNLVLVHPVPAAAYFLLAGVYVPPLNELIKQKLGFRIHPLAKVLLGVVIIWFTLGVSDLGDMMD